jgi:hypothetical protein
MIDRIDRTRWDLLQGVGRPAGTLPDPQHAWHLPGRQQTSESAGWASRRPSSSAARSAMRLHMQAAGAQGRPELSKSGADVCHLHSACQCKRTGPSCPASADQKRTLSAQ